MPSPPLMLSSPPPPSSVSSPPAPDREFAAELPIITLASSLPPPLIAAEPVKRQVLDIGAERVGDGALDRVDARIDAFERLGNDELIL